MAVNEIFKVNLNGSRNMFVNKKEDYLIEFTISGEDNLSSPLGVYESDTYDKLRGHFLLNNNVFLTSNEILNISNTIEKVLCKSEIIDFIYDDKYFSINTFSKLNVNLCKYYRIKLLMKDIKREINSISNIIYDILENKYGDDNLEDWFYRLIDYDDNNINIELDTVDIGFDLVKDYKYYLKENEALYNKIRESVLLLIDFKNNNNEEVGMI